MKYSSTLVAFAIMFICQSPHHALAADASESALVEKVAPERFDAKVLKVFAAKDGAAVFRAYLVSWKGQEVIVSDPLVKAEYKEGDSIPVLAMNHPFPQGKEPHRLLAFTVLPSHP
jgi:hypothetical protein